MNRTVVLLGSGAVAVAAATYFYIKGLTDSDNDEEHSVSGEVDSIVESTPTTEFLLENLHRLEHERDEYKNDVEQMRKILNDHVASRPHHVVERNNLFPSPESIAASWNEIIFEKCSFDEALVENRIDPSQLYKYLFSIQEVAKGIVQDKVAACMHIFGFKEYDENHPQLQLIRHQLQNSFKHWSETIIDHHRVVSDIHRQGIDEDKIESGLEDLLKVFAACYLNDPIIALEDESRTKLDVSFNWRIVPHEQWLDARPTNNATEKIKCGIPALEKGSRTIARRHYFVTTV